MNRRILITLVLAGSLTAGAYAQDDPESQVLPSPVREVPLRFEHLSLEDGLSQSSVFDILQDRDGFMWFGTEDGLNRYDGHTFTVFKHIPFDSTSLITNRANTLLEDESGALWVGTTLGLNKMDSGTGTFISYHHDPDDSTSLSNNDVRALYQEPSGVLWVGTIAGLNRMDPETGAFTRYRHDPEDSASLSHNIIWDIHEDQAGALWVATPQGLNRLDRETGVFARYLLTPGSSDFDINAFFTSIRDDPNRPDVLWVSGSGLLRFDTNTGEAKRYLADAEDVRENIVFDFTPDAHRPDVFWVAKGGGGLVRFDTRTEQARRYRQDPSDPLSLHSNDLFSIYTDQSGIIWAGAQSQQGLVKFDPSAGGFIHYRHVPGDANSLHYGNVWRVFEDREGVLWAVVANEALRTYDRLNRIDRATGQVTQYFEEPVDLLTTNGQIRQLYEDHAGLFWIVFQTQGLKRLDRATGRIVSYQHNPNDTRSLSSNFPHGMFEDQEGVLWIGTHSGGLNRYERATNTFTRYQHNPEDSTSLSGNSLSEVLEDGAGALWVSTHGDGLNRMDRQTGTFTRYRHDPEDSTSLAADNVLDLFVDHAGHLWILTFGDTQGNVLNRFHPETERFTRYAHDPRDPSSLSGRRTRRVYERAREPGILWIATPTGLNRLDTHTDAVTYYTEQDGLANNFIYDILEDEEGRLWMSTNKGLSCFTPETETFRNYDVADGLQSNEFNAGAAYKGPSGELFFGGINGITAFFPHEVLDNPVPPSVVFTDFRIFNETVAPGPDTPLEQPIAEAEEIRLKHWQKSIAFDFVGLHFQNSEKNAYAYRLEGFDPDWVAAGTQRTAAYTNLDPGDYTFRVRAANSDGVWNEAGASVRVVVSPPWWQTWWAYLFYAVFLVGFVVAVDRFQRARVIRKERQRAEVEQAELRAGAAEAQARALQAENERKQIELEKSKELEEAYQSLEATHEQLEQSHIIVEAINKETSFTRLLHTILDEARIIPGVEKATALVYDANRDAFVFRASSGWDVEQLRPIRMTADEAHARYVAHTEEVAEDIVVAKDAAARPGAERFAELGMAASFLVLRVRVEDEVAGYLIFDNMTDRDAFDHQDVALLEGLREHIRSAFIKTRLLDDLHEKNEEISEALDHLKTTQAQLVQSEKMASLGQLTAGIAHEIKNPLNFVNNFAQLCTELADELTHELDAHDGAPVSEVRDHLKDILDDLKVNAGKIEEHGKRADGIVKSMLLHSGGKPGERRLTDVNALLDEYVNLAYHGKRAQVNDFNVTLERDYDEAVGEIEIVPQEIGRVLVNLLNNAFDAVQERMSTGDGAYTPRVSVATRRQARVVEIEVRDNGPGMPEGVAQKIFEPFFTTKPTGEGTGLGLSMSYDIVVQGHGGTLAVESAEGEGAAFLVTLPA